MPEDLDRVMQIIEKVLPFGLRVKNRLRKLNKLNTVVRVLCPNPEHTQPTYVRAILAGRRMHLHMGCEDPKCPYRMME